MTSLVLLVLTTAHFLVGVFGQKLSCDVLANMGTGAEEPQQRELYDFIDRQFPLTALNPHGVVKDDLVTVSNIIKYAPRTDEHPLTLSLMDSLELLFFSFSLLINDPHYLHS